MSSRKWIFRIQDILVAIDKVERYTKGLSLAQFKKKELVIDAVVRNLEVIGEASNHVPLTARHSAPAIPWDQMRAMRNILIHEYFGVDIKIVWHTAKKYLPPLRKPLKTLLQENIDK